MTMHINLSSEMETFIRGKVASGFYGNATEVIRDAIRRMQAEENRVLAWEIAIQQGSEGLEQGQGMPYSTSALNNIGKTALNNINSGKQTRPGVLP